MKKFIVYQNMYGNEDFISEKAAIKYLKKTIEDSFTLTVIDENDNEKTYNIKVEIKLENAVISDPLEDL